MIIKKIILTFFFIFSSYAWGNIIDKNGNILPEVIIIFKKFHPDLESNPSLKSLNDIGQKKFLRKGERLSPQAIKSYQDLCASLSAEDKKEILDCFKAIGDIQRIYPTSACPDYILIQG